MTTHTHNGHKDYDNVPGNHFDKYSTKNPIARALMDGFMSNFDDLVTKSGCQDAFEVGCGEGELSTHLLKRGIEAHGCDLEKDVVQEANQLSVKGGYGERFKVESVYDIAPGTISQSLIICCEVLEHLPEPEAALKILVSQMPDYLILSVPREPVWRGMNLARGKYISKLGNTPGHIQHWSTSGFLKMVKRHCDVIELRKPLPWTMVLVKPL